MTKKQLAARLRKKFKRAAPDEVTASWYLDRVFEEIRDSLRRGETVRITGFGRWDVIATKAKKVQRIDPRTRTAVPMELPPGTKVRFCASETWSGEVLLSDVPPARNGSVP